MADFWGLDAIATRLNVAPHTVVRWFERRAFPMYRRRRGSPHRRWWYTNDDLIRTWHLAQVELYRAHHMRDKQSQTPPDAPDGSQPPDAPDAPAPGPSGRPKRPAPTTTRGSQAPDPTDGTA